MTWWQILLLVLGVLWTAGASVVAFMAVIFQGSRWGERMSPAEHGLVAVLWAIGPALIILAVAT